LTVHSALKKRLPIIDVMAMIQFFAII